MWWLPVVVGLTAGGILTWSAIERRQVRQDLDRVFEQHAASVARLIFESTRQAAEAIDTLYALTEDELAARAELVSSSDAAAGSAVEVVLLQSGDEDFSGRWGPVPEFERRAFRSAVLAAAPGVITEAGSVGRHDLSCLHRNTNAGRVIICRPAERLARLRRQIGLGPLLSQVARGSLRYAAIQDAGGILAASPGASLSRWQDDTRLAQVRDRPADAGMVFRLVEGPEGELFEGLRAFPLPDGTTAVLRVGIDAASMTAVQADIDWRHQLLYAVLGVLLLFSLAGTWMLVRRERLQRRAEQELVAREQQQRHWQAIAQMAATVAHEVRNPLNTLKMAAQRLEREFEVPEADRADYSGLVTVLGSEVERVEAVVTGFLELGRPLVLNRTALQLDRWVAEAIAPLRLRAEQEGKRLEVAASGAQEVVVDGRRLGQVMANLAGNALDAVEPGGTVMVRAWLEQDELRLDITDDGPGMDAAMLQQAGEPFVTTKRRGTGLGLPLARRLVEAHGGELRLESAPQRGTRAVVRLPAAGRVEE